MNDLLITTWKQQRQWSIAADRLNKQYVFWQNFSLWLIVIGAFSVTLSVQYNDGILRTVLLISGSVVLALIPVFGKWKANSEQLKELMRARSIAEELDTQIYLYLGKCSDYSSRKRDALLIKNTEALIKDADMKVIHGIEPDEKKIPVFKPAVEDDAESYIKSRLNNQIQYYKENTKNEQKSINRYRKIQLSFSITAPVLSILALFFKAPGTWVAVLTTITAAIAAKLAAGQHERLAILYGSAKFRLESLKARKITFPEPGAFVKECEDAISAQNESWIAQYLKKKIPQ